MVLQYAVPERGRGDGSKRDQWYGLFHAVHLDPSDDLTAMNRVTEVSETQLQGMLVVLIPPVHVTLVSQTECRDVFSESNRSQNRSLGQHDGGLAGLGGDGQRVRRVTGLDEYGGSMMAQRRRVHEVPSPVQALGDCHH